MNKLDFFTKKWFPTNLIILIVVLIIIGFLVWGGLTNWKFIPKKPITHAPIPIPSNTYIITTAKLEEGIGYGNNKGGIQLSNIIHKEIINSVYIDDNQNFIIKIDSPSKYPLAPDFFTNVKVFGETNELIFLSNSEQVEFKLDNNSGMWTWNMTGYIEGLKWDINKNYKIIFTGNFPQPKKSISSSPKPITSPSSPKPITSPSSQPSPKPTSAPTPSPKPICKKSVDHNRPPLDINICSTDNDCCNLNNNIKCIQCIPQDASELIPKFLQCQGTPKSYCQYNTKLSLFNMPFDGLISRFAISISGFEIVILGGSESGGLVHYYTPDNKWNSLINNKMINIRQDFASVYLNNTIYAIGGRPDNGNDALASVEIFNYGCGTLKDGSCSAHSSQSSAADWNNSYVPNMKQPRYGHNACILNNKIYVIGGINNSFPNGIPIVEMYEPITNSWITSDDYKNPNKPPMLNNRRSFGQAVTFNNKIYVIGGYDNKSVQYYDPLVSTTWQDYIPLNNIRSNFSAVVAPAVSGYNGMSIYIMGGIITSSINQISTTDDVQILDTKKTQWVSITHLSTPRAYGGAVCPILWNNRPDRNYIYMFGGSDENNSPLNTIDKFDISTNSWEQI